MNRGNIPEPPGPVNGERFVGIGGMYATAEPCDISTILGSCVSVVLWDAGMKAGGINHFRSPSMLIPDPNPLNFGEAAIPALYDSVMRLGCSRSGLTARIVGGACMLCSWFKSLPPVGQRNIECAEVMLRGMHVPVVERVVGGEMGRNLKFSTSTGVISVKDYANTIRRLPTPDDPGRVKCVNCEREAEAALRNAQH